MASDATSKSSSARLQLAPDFLHRLDGCRCTAASSGPWDTCSSLLDGNDSGASAMRRLSLAALAPSERRDLDVSPRSKRASAPCRGHPQGSDGRMQQRGGATPHLSSGGAAGRACDGATLDRIFGGAVPCRSLPCCTWQRWRGSLRPVKRTALLVVMHAHKNNVVVAGELCANSNSLCTYSVK